MSYKIGDNGFFRFKNGYIDYYNINDFFTVIISEPYIWLAVDKTRHCVDVLNIKDFKKYKFWVDSFTLE